MKTLRQTSIKRLILGITCICTVLLCLVQLSFYGEFRKNMEEGQNETAMALCQQIAQSFSIRSEQLENSFEILITDQSLLEFLSTDSRGVQYEAINNLSSTIEYIYMSQPDLRDVVLVDMEGNPFSFFSVFTVSDVDTFGKICDFQDPTQRDRASVYLPASENVRNDSYAYILPILETRPGKDFGAKIGTVILYYSIQSIREEIELSNNLPNMRVSLVDADNRVIATGPQGEEAEAVNGPYIVTDGKTQYKQHLEHINWDVYCEYDKAFVDEGNRLYLKYVVALAVVALTGILFSAYTMNKCLSEPIQSLLSQMRTSAQESQARIHIKEKNEVGEIATGINTMLDRLNEKTLAVINAQEKVYTTELLRQASELKALNSQINPHFLYNTLECIRGMALMSEQDTIAEIATAMADIFRYSIKGKDIVTVAQEMKMIENYLFIIQCRFEDRYKMEICVDPCLQRYAIPKMIIQPIVENAIVHGLADVESGGMLRIEGKDQGDSIAFSVINNGTPIPQDVIRDLEKASPYDNASSGIGLRNIKSRIQLLMGESALLKIESSEAETKVSVVIPKIVRPELLVDT